MKKIKELDYLDNNNRLTELFDMENPVDCELVKQIKTGELSFCVVDIKEWTCCLCGSKNDVNEKYCWFCEHEK